MILVEYGIPRRCRIDLLTPVELKIREAILAVEEAGCDVLLTDTVDLLTQAKDKLADYVDMMMEIEIERRSREADEAHRP